MQKWVLPFSLYAAQNCPKIIVHFEYLIKLNANQIILLTGKQETRREKNTSDQDN